MQVPEFSGVAPARRDHEAQGCSHALFLAHRGAEECPNLFGRGTLHVATGVGAEEIDHLALKGLHELP